jgi:hypothetical protein
MSSNSSFAPWKTMFNMFHCHARMFNTFDALMLCDKTSTKGYLLYHVVA